MGRTRVDGRMIQQAEQALENRDVEEKIARHVTLEVRIGAARLPLFLSRAFLLFYPPPFLFPLFFPSFFFFFL